MFVCTSSTNTLPSVWQLLVYCHRIDYLFSSYYVKGDMMDYLRYFLVSSFTIKAYFSCAALLTSKVVMTNRTYMFLL